MQTSPSPPSQHSLRIDPDVCERARLSRDARFDGRFFTAVRTTGVYCRPVCPVRAPKRENVSYFVSAAAAAEAGFRPCLRCRPELSAGTPDWSNGPTAVGRALRLIAEGAAEEGGVGHVADRLGITPRHLNRLFHEHLGASPLAVIRTRRLHVAKRLIDDTDLRLADVAFAAGFGSVRRFNATFQELYARSPGELRRNARRLRPTRPEEEFVFRLSYRPPLDWRSLIGFLGPRATPGVEIVRGGRYRRLVRLGERPAVVEVSTVKGKPALELRVRSEDSSHLLQLAERTRRVFDLGADPQLIRRHLARDPRLRPWLPRRFGSRVPGAWDGFEVTVRAILGQQISVKAATTLAGRIASHCGDPVVTDCEGLTHLFPTPDALADANLDGLGVTGRRIETIRAVAGAVCDGRLSFDIARPERLLESLQQIPGIGAWTAQYVAMRLGEPDAFPSSDLGLLKSRASEGATTPRELEERAEAWRPWRAYAAIVLWNSYGDPTS